MTPEAFKAMMAKASAGTRLANAGNPALIEAFRPPAAQAVDARAAVAAGNRLTTAEENLNKTETAYLAILRSENHLHIHIQAITLILGHDLRYTADFAVLDPTGLTLIDTKGGHTWEDSLIKLRIAARMFPWIRFVIARKTGDHFEHTEIKP